MGFEFGHDFRAVLSMIGNAKRDGIPQLHIALSL